MKIEKEGLMCEGAQRRDCMRSKTEGTFEKKGRHDGDVLGIYAPCAVGGNTDHTNHPDAVIAVRTSPISYLPIL